MSVVIFGSINLDLVARTPRLPVPGETLIGHTFETISGGKGANQAVAVARLGIEADLIGRVGGDAFGETLIRELRANGVGCDRILVDSAIASGVALIAVDDQSENQIIVIPGANGQVAEPDLQRLQAVLPQAKVLLLQLEIPLPAVIAAAEAAKQADVTVILDPAPAHCQLPDTLYPYLDFITPNQVEASQLVGFPVEDFTTAEKAAQTLCERGVRTAIVKLGKAGALYVSEHGTVQIPAFAVRAIDTVAAGDAFNGGLAAGLAAGLTLHQAVIQASAVGALSVTKKGAQPSLPTREELQTFLEKHKISG